jgi:hypothetical protein
MTESGLVFIYAVVIAALAVWLCILTICCVEARGRRRDRMTRAQWRRLSEAFTAELEAISTMPLSTMPPELRRFVDKSNRAVRQLEDQAALITRLSLAFDANGAIEKLRAQKAKAEQMLAAVSRVDPSLLALLDQAFSQAGLPVVDGLRVHNTDDDLMT